ncbi:MAG: NUMOD3 domain-containing DNA-binding protein, partial [bacterium]
KNHKSGCDCIVCRDKSGKNNPMYGKNRKLSDEHKLNISKSLKGKNNPMFGLKNEEHPASKISEKNGIEIYYEFYNTEKSVEEIAKEYKIDSSTVYRIKNGNHWSTSHLEKKESKNNKNSKINKKKGKEIYNKYHNTNKTLKQLAKDYNISVSLVSLIKRGEHWSVS